MSLNIVLLKRIIYIYALFLLLLLPVTFVSRLCISKHRQPPNGVGMCWYCCALTLASPPHLVTLGD